MIKTNHDLTYKTWFITFTCYKWVHLFEITNSYSLVYNWLNLIKEKYQIETIAFVVMPNHVHLILQLPDSVNNLNTVISNGKRFMAYELVKKLIVQNEQSILFLLSSGCSDKEKAKGQKHKVFEPSFDAKPIYTPEFLNQKIDYIHYNPVTGKWNLSDQFTDYSHSSAAFYYDNKPHAYININNYSEIFGASQGPLRETLRGQKS